MRLSKIGEQTFFIDKFYSTAAERTLTASAPLAPGARAATEPPGARPTIMVERSTRRPNLPQGPRPDHVRARSPVC
jgi:hypothetical protein